MDPKTSDILKEIDALSEIERKQLLQQLYEKYDDLLDEGENGVSTDIQIQLEEANRKVDQILPDLWAQAKRNLEQAEDDYKRGDGKE